MSATTTTGIREQATATTRTKTIRLTKRDREAVEHARRTLEAVNATLYDSDDPLALAWDLSVAAGALGVLLGILDKIGGRA